MFRNLIILGPGLALTLALASGAASSGEPITMKPTAMPPPSALIKLVSSRQVSVTHQDLEIEVSYAAFTRNFEAILGRFDPTVSATLASDPAAAQARIRQMEGEQGLMIFAVQNHGALFALAGAQRHAKRYHVGNPGIAFQMTRHDIRAGLYAPLSVLVYEAKPGAVRVEFDQPSTLFGQFGDADVLAVARALDGKLEKVIEHAAMLAVSQQPGQ
ncbi:hypothetical protein OR16_03412 [Cupriavidus basilensis OR16]|uniref:DUF302 domain-containing protein n=2 Tax=Cupriavidus basilensis TaxID=68895 RepID=H1RZE5_9BURK|nr:hypothetical protein OR16_03412 [Cupriavidus basilensis OR16]